MYTVSDAAFLAELRGSHSPSARVVCLDGDRSVRQVFESHITGGTATFDRTRTVRRTASLRLVGAGTPSDFGDLFAPGSLVRIERGASGRYLPLVTGPVSHFDASMSGELSIGADDTLALVSQPAGDVIVIPAGTPAEVALVLLWGSILGTFADPSEWSLDGGGRTTGTVVVAEDEDLLYAGVNLMTSLGLEVFADRRGIPVLRPVPDYTTQSVARSFTTASGSSTLLSLYRRGERPPYNRVVAISDPWDGPVYRSVQSVTDPYSPIHANAIGVRTAPVYRTAYAPDQATVNRIARVLLMEYSLFQDAVGLSSTPDVTLDESDVVRATEAESGTDDDYVINRVTHPIGAGSMTMDTTRVVPVWLL